MEDRKVITKGAKSITVVGIFLSIILVIGFFALLSTPVWIALKNNQNININKQTLITADALLTTATVTLIAFNGVGARNSGSATIIRTVFWKVLKIKADEKRVYFAWTLSLSYIRPSVVLFITTITTLIEVSLLNNGNELIITLFYFFLLSITSLLLLSTISRIVIFNLVVWLDTTSHFISKRITKKKIRPWIIRILSYIRGSKNFELISKIINDINELSEKNSDLKPSNLDFNKEIQSYRRWNDAKNRDNKGAISLLIFNALSSLTEEKNKIIDSETFKNHWRVNLILSLFKEKNINMDDDKWANIVSEIIVILRSYGMISQETINDVEDNKRELTRKLKESETKKEISKHFKNITNIDRLIGFINKREKIKLDKTTLITIKDGENYRIQTTKGFAYNVYIDPSKKPKNFNKRNSIVFFSKIFKKTNWCSNVKRVYILHDNKSVSKYNINTAQK